jgi:hypothetical protein
MLVLLIGAQEALVPLLYPDSVEFNGKQVYGID